MIFFLVIISLLTISVILAVLSYRNVHKVHELGKVKEELSKGKVVFQTDTSRKKEEKN